MSSQCKRRRRRTHRVSVLPVLVALVGSAACGDDDGGSTGPSGPFRLTFRLDASFHGAHGGQAIEIALVRTPDGEVVVQGSGAVSATEDPSFTFTTGPVMEEGVTYEVHYWIDSNLGGGTVAVCDEKAIDHQWSVELLSVSNDVMFTTSHQPALTEDVCSTFT